MKSIDQGKDDSIKHGTDQEPIGGEEVYSVCVGEGGQEISVAGCTMLDGQSNVKVREEL